MTTTQNKTAWGGKTGTSTGTTWSRGNYGQGNKANDQNSEFSTVGIDGSSAGGFSIGAWANLGKEEKKDATKTGFGLSTQQKEKGTAWGALKREQERKKEGRGGTGRGTQAKPGFASKTGFGTTGFGTTGFGANKTTGFGSFGTGAKTTYGTGTSTYGTGAKTSTYSFGTGQKSTFSFGANKTAENLLKKLRESEEYITSQGQPFLSFPVRILTRANEEKECESKHICSVPRFYDYPVEMLRYYDYVFGGGIDWVDPNPAVAAKKEEEKKGFGLQGGTQYEKYSPWKLDISDIKIDPEQAGQVSQPFGVLPAAVIQAEQSHQEIEDEEEFTPIRQRGFLVSRTLFDNMKDYSGPSKTPGFKKVEPSHAKGFYF